MAGPSGSIFPRLAVMAVVDSTGTGLFLAASVVVFTHLVGLTGQQVGIALTVGGVISLAASLPFGVLVDQFGPRAVLIVVSVWRACGLIGYGWCRDFSSFLAVTCLLAVADRASPSITQALVAATVPADRRVRTMAWLRSLRNVGFTVGALLAGAALAVGSSSAYLCILVGDALSFVVVAVVALSLVVPVKLARHRVPAAENFRRRRGANALGEARHFRSRTIGVPAPLRDGLFVRATLLNAILSVHMTLLAVGMPILVVEHTSVSRTILSPLLAVNTVLTVAFQVRLSRGTTSAAGSSLALRRSGMSLAACCALLAVVPSIPTGAAIGVLIAAVLALTVGELTQSAGGWGLSYALAPESSRGIYLSTFEAGVTAQQVFGPGLLLAVLIPLGMWGWLALGVGVLAAGAAVVPVTRQEVRASRPPRRSSPRADEPEDPSSSGGDDSPGTARRSREGYPRADPASAGRRLVRAIGAGAGVGDRTAVHE